ncbi:unnamed protein product [Parajaminaea phylloscopi]
MSSILGAFPAIAGRTFLAPIGRLPAKYTNTEIVFGGKSEGSHGESSAPRFTSKPLEEILEQVPSAKSFRPHPLLPLGNLQTFYSAWADTSDIDVVFYKRHVLLLPDGGTIAIDVSPPEWDEAETSEGQERPTVVLNHGLTGGSHESYVRHVIPPLTASGYRCVVVNFRGCGQTPVTSPQMYSAGKTDDLRSGLLWMMNRWKRTEFVLMGFSLGANVVAKYMGEEGDNAPVRGALVLATPFDLKMGSDSLESRTVYDKAMAMNLTRKIGVAAHALALDPSLRQPLYRLLNSFEYSRKNADDVQKRGVKTSTLKWVDDSITRLAGGFSGPYGDFPFDTADDYYNANGSIHYIHRVARPMLCLNSDDDPIVPYPILESTKQAMRGNPNVALGITHGGGHLGWWSSKGSKSWTARWLGPAAKEWVEQVFRTPAAESKVDYMSRANPWTLGDVKTITDVTFELMSEDELLDFEPATLAAAEIDGPEVEEQISKVRDALPNVGTESEQAKEPAAEPATTQSDGADASLPPRHAWLITQVLPSARLIHPSQHPKFEGVQYPQERQLVTGGSMTQCISRPQVGYLELPQSSRVAGCGEVFQGGKAIPGQTTDAKGDRIDAKNRGTNSKRPSQRKGLRERGTIAGL